MSYLIAIGQEPGNSIDGVTVENNYLDYSGAYGPFYPPSGRNLTFMSNVDMVSGHLIGAPLAKGQGAMNWPSISGIPSSLSELSCQAKVLTVPVWWAR